MDHNNGHTACWKFAWPRFNDHGQSRPVDITQAVLRPCDWVTVREMETITGITSVEATPTDDYMGAVSPGCTYTGSGHSVVTSTLETPQSFSVDARSELEMWKTDGHPGSPISGLPAIEAYCTDEGILMAVLSGGRGYLLMDWDRNMSCDKLAQIAQLALGRIPK